MKVYHSFEFVKNKIYKIRATFFFLFLLVTQTLFFNISANARDYSASSFFTYAELQTLYEQEKLPESLEEKLNRLLTVPLVDNSYASSSPAVFSQSPQLGEFLRVVHWNIERGLEYKALETVFANKELFEAILDKKEFPPASDRRRQALEQAAMLQAADVIILNEVDLGMKRTDYRNITAELAARLKMNYAFGVQFVELTPIHLGKEKENATEQQKELTELIRVDPELYKGLHGVAILSRFPLENVRLVPYKNQPYDWYKTEKNGASLLEKGKRKISEKVFLEETMREVRRGGRTTLLAEIADARFPTGRVTIAATHLENRTKSENRVKQLEELLDTIKNVSNPVILAGDMNTSGMDLTPTTLRRELIKRYGKPGYWVRKGISYALGFGMIEDTILDGLTYWRTQSDPTVRHVPFLMPNPEHKFFSTLKDFRFSDGNAFDFRGDRERSAGNSDEMLANSNQRGNKGFITTYQVKRPIKFVGRYKLDWIFVKPAVLRKPEDSSGSYRFAPHFGRTCAEVNESVPDRISDHRPLIVDLPLDEPPIKKPKKN